MRAASMRVCEQRVCEYASMRVCEYASMRVCEQRVCEYVSMRVCEYASGRRDYYVSMPLVYTCLHPLRPSVRPSYQSNLSANHPFVHLV
jgi:hypothetical protein